MSGFQNLPSLSFLNFPKRANLTFEQLKKVAREKNLISIIPEEESLIILIDIVGFSNSDSRTQFANIFIFQHFLRSFLFSKLFAFGEKIRIRNFVSTGDGCYIVADKCEPEVAVEFLVTMVSGFQGLKDFSDNSLSIRVSALIGKIIPFMDLAHHKNFVGEGMNEAERILTCGRKELEERFMAQGHTEEEAHAFSQNSLFLGESLFSGLENKSEYCMEKSENCYDFKAVTDKHGKSRDIKVLQGIHEYNNF